MLWTVFKVCLTIGLVVGTLTYHGWLHDRAQATPDRRVFGDLTSAAVLRGLFILVGESLAWGVFIFIWPVGYLGDYLSLNRRGGTRRPVLLVHGFLHNRTAWVAHGLRLRLAGWTQVYSINLWPLSGDLDDFARQVDQAVERICTETGSDTVDLVCHSMGGVVARAYIQRFGGRDRVARLVTLGSPHHGTTIAPLSLSPNALAMGRNSDYLAELEADPDGLGAVAATAIFTLHDNIVMPAESAALPPPAQTRQLEGVGHAGLLWSPAAWHFIQAALQTEPDAAGEPG